MPKRIAKQNYSLKIIIKTYLIIVILVFMGRSKSSRFRILGEKMLNDESFYSSIFSKKYFFCYESVNHQLSKLQNKRVFATNFDFLIPISLQSYVIDLRYFKLRFLLDQII